MLKVKQYDYKDSNVAGIGSALDKAARESAAKSEPAWEGAGEEEGLQVWRVEKFTIQPWDKDDYGQFFDGDAYIVLKTFKKKDSDKLNRDVHFWLGCDCSQDEAGTAAYKTVELDDKLGGAAVQHREVMGFESQLFLSYFPPSVRLLHGGVESGFRRVPQVEEYKPRLLRIRQGPRPKKEMTTFEVPLHNAALNQGDVYILDQGNLLFQWQGKDSSGMERNRAATVVRQIDSERNGQVSVEVLEGGDENPDFHALLEGSREDVLSKDQADEILGKSQPPEGDVEKVEKRLFRLSDAEGDLQFTQVGLDEDRSSDDVYILDAGDEIFVWIGQGASPQERLMAMATAQKYLEDNKRPPYTPIACMHEGNESEQFLQAATSG